MQDRLAVKVLQITGHFAPRLWLQSATTWTIQTSTSPALGHLLKMRPFQQYSVHRAHQRQCAIMHYINLTLKMTF